MDDDGLETQDARAHGLSERMMVMLELAYHNHSNRAIAALLHISHAGVKNRLALIYRRVGLDQRPGAWGRVDALRWWHTERRHQRRVVARVALLLAGLTPVDQEPCVARGEGIAHARLSAASVREIRRLHAGGLSGGGWTGEALARRYGVSRATIRRVVRGETWRHVRTDDRKAS